MIIDLVTDMTAKDIKNAIDENKNAIVAAITNKYDEDATLAEVKDLRTIDGVTHTTAGVAIKSKFDQVDEDLDNKANIEDLVNGITFKGSDTTVNIKAKTDMVNGDKWYSTDEDVYYMYSSSGWINCGSGKNLALIENEIGELKETLGDTSKEYTTVDNKLIIDGVERNSSVFTLVKDIDVSYGETVYVRTSLAGTGAIAVFDKNGNALMNLTIDDGVLVDASAKIYDFTINIPENATTMSVSFCKYVKPIDILVIKTVDIYNYLLQSIQKTTEETELEKEVYFACGDSITHGNHAGIPTISDTEPFCPLGGSDGFTDYKNKEYAYYIAKKNNFNWYNYGIGGSTLTNCKVNGITFRPFSEPNGRYTKLANGVTPNYITIFFGWNDAVWGTYQEAEKWLKTTYGSDIYYPTPANLIGTTHSDGTPYATQSQYDACMACSETINGKQYTGLQYFKMKFIGDIESTDVTTWYGAWNTVLEYFILKYPFAKIIPIVPYNKDMYAYYTISDEMREAVRLVSQRWGLSYFDFDSEEHQMFTGKGYIANTFTTTSGYLNVRDYRCKKLLADGLHPNTDGYKYIANMISSKMISV